MRIEKVSLLWAYIEGGSRSAVAADKGALAYLMI
jgi:hypothetical protein